MGACGVGHVPHGDLVAAGGAGQEGPAGGERDVLRAVRFPAAACRGRHRGVQRAQQPGPGRAGHVPQQDLLVVGGGQDPAVRGKHLPPQAAVAVGQRLQLGWVPGVGNVPQGRIAVEGDGGHGAAVRRQRRGLAALEPRQAFRTARVPDVPQHVHAGHGSPESGDHERRVRGETNARQAFVVGRVPVVVLPGPVGEREGGHHERSRCQGREQHGPAQPGQQRPSRVPGRIEVRADRAGPHAGHGPRGRAVLAQDVEYLLAVALPPAPRVAADQRAGQPAGQPGPHHARQAVAVRSRATCATCCIVAICSARISSPPAVIS